MKILAIPRPASDVRCAIAAHARDDLYTLWQWGSAGKGATREGS
jgi:hypothetical protein